jgi:hypothetical protein
MELIHYKINLKLVVKRKTKKIVLFTDLKKMILTIVVFLII